jgi:hypothetical protein
MIGLNDRFESVIGTDVAKETNRTRRVDKGKSGQALKNCGEWRLWGRHPLTVIKASV